MYYKGVEINISNYKDIFREVSEDVLDEIRLAVLDNTDIISYIDICGEDSYKLGQIRIALRNKIPRRYIRYQMTPKTIHLIRLLYLQGKDISPLESYMGIDNIKLEPNLLEEVVLAYYLGGSIETINFTEVPEKNIKILCQGLVRKYPMWLMTGSDLTEGYIKLLLRGMDLGLDISMFIKDVIDEDKLVILLSNSSSIDINKFITYITPKFSSDSINILIEAYKDGLDFEPLTYRDSDGYPVYTEYQMYVLLKALRLKKQGVSVDEGIFNPRLSDYDMERMLDKYKET